MAERFVIGCKIECEIDRPTMDYAFAWLIRWLEPRLEVVLGLLGARNVRFTGEFARHPLEGE